MYPPRIGIYVGEGASHSWIWFVDTLERAGILNIVFLDERNWMDMLRALDILMIGGGDPCTIQKTLGNYGLGSILEFIDGGGIYIGSCAGAYLPLRSFGRCSSIFGVVEADLQNLSGDGRVFHPVRGPIRIRMRDEVFDAPLYGGPSIAASEDIDVLASYDGFTERTSFLSDRFVAEEKLIGNAAIIRKRYGEGVFYLYGPHLEHPDHLLANRVMIETIASRRGRESGAFKEVEGNVIDQRWLRRLKREISNARIVAHGLETYPVRWKLGYKIWNPEKIAYFLNAIWKRLGYIESRIDEGIAMDSDPDEFINSAADVTASLKQLRRMLGHGEDTTELAATLFHDLKMLTSSFLLIYLEDKMRKFKYDKLEVRDDGERSLF
ncbi:MAG: Biotin-protein ligase [Candidatus Syntrophoarchaeum caldarius]|uniref:Biotin-protein ligase n=1 Tax=Candidatus Syntropharchaeum caldarium TaxID=1838285 RepID=A0A1F2P838_9EURY|nr:MAG: Biotin-protein ligase [Candidatus Syntrophoarchaeum caldarius]